MLILHIPELVVGGSQMHTYLAEFAGLAFDHVNRAIIADGSSTSGGASFIVPENNRPLNSYYLFNTSPVNSVDQIDSHNSYIYDYSATGEEVYVKFLGRMPADSLIIGGWYIHT